MSLLLSDGFFLSSRFLRLFYFIFQYYFGTVSICSLYFLFFCNNFLLLRFVFRCKSVLMTHIQPLFICFSLALFIYPHLKFFFIPFVTFFSFLFVHFNIVFNMISTRANYNRVLLSLVQKQN